MKDVILPNPDNLEKIKDKMKSSGQRQIHVLADFDRTLSYATQENGEKIPSIISILRDRDYLSSEYSSKAKALFKKYHPIEINPEISIQDKKREMQKWWNSHNELLIQSGLNNKDLERIVNSGAIRLRDGVKELFKYTNQLQIPLVIMSSSGVGDTISMILEKERILYDNIYIITNKFKWDDEGTAIGKPNPVIHCMNKDETVIEDYPEIYNKIKDRKNVILIGDSLGDLGMTTGFEYNELLKVGFLNPGEEGSEPQYRKAFDIIITGDSSAKPIKKLMEEIA